MTHLSFQNFRSPAALACFLLTAVIGFALDQWSKVEAFDKLSGGGVVRMDDSVRPLDPHTVRFIPGWLHFDVTANQGAVFGIGQGQRALFVAVSVAAIVFILYLFATSGRQREPSDRVLPPAPIVRVVSRTSSSPSSAAPAPSPSASSTSAASSASGRSISRS